MEETMPHETREPFGSSGLALNPVRGRINAAFFRVMDWYMHWKYADLKRRLFADLPRTVVELGAGAGANFRYLRHGSRVIAVEPNRYMHASLRRNAARWGVDLEIRGLGGEGLDLDDASVETVICSLVLCTVESPAQVLSEIRRVLTPNGRFICIEHVAAPSDAVVGRIQRWVFRPWKWFFEGCHTHRDTARTLRAAGFSRIEVESFTWPSVFVPVRPQIAAVCVK
jgi:ubiquinone/menaquinone biosynthesis C-methylase UbiE